MADPTAEGSSRNPEPQPDPAGRMSVRQLLQRLLLYHLSLTVALVVLVLAVPASVDHLPVGGISELAERAGSNLAVRPAGTQGEESTAVEVADSRRGVLTGHAAHLAAVLIGLWLLMLPVSWLHRGIYRTTNYDHSLDETTLILPGVVAGVVVVVQHSLALAFALAGVAASVRFRRALQDTFDAQFILLAIGVGIAGGVGALEIAAVMSVFFCYATLYLCGFGDGLQSDFKGRQKAARRASARAEAEEARTRPSDTPPP